LPKAGVIDGIERRLKAADSDQKRRGGGGGGG
jgi:hypothetical protein